jgi:hypothetical protein
VSVSTAVFLSLAGCALPVEGPETGRQKMPLQLDYLGWPGRPGSYGVSLTNTNPGGMMGVSTAMIRHVDPEKYMISCGMTFVSNHYAITAAHCVPGKSVNGTFNDIIGNSTSLTIEEYYIKNLNYNFLTLSALVSGPDYTWPEYFRPYRLDDSVGYVVRTTTGCKVVRRCSKNYGQYNCNLAAVNGLGDPNYVDLALVYCPNRNWQGRSWLYASSSTNYSQNVQVWWFNEVLYLATNPGTVDPNQQPLDNWDHYGYYYPNPPAPVPPINYHYYQADGASDLPQPLPLISYRDASGKRYKSSGRSTDWPQLQMQGYTVNTNVPSCHGMSGSGVFNDSGELLGVAGADLALATSYRLCENMSGTQTGVHMQYIDQAWTHQLSVVPEVCNDRCPGSKLCCH